MLQVLDEEWFARNPKAAHDKMMRLSEDRDEALVLAKAAGAGYREEERRRRRCEAALRVARGYVTEFSHGGRVPKWSAQARTDLRTIDDALGLNDGDGGEGR